MKRCVLIAAVLVMTGWAAGFSQDHAALMLAVNTGDLETFKKELDPVDDLDEIVINGFTLLNYSILGVHPDFVEYLLDRGVDVEEPSRRLSPLMHAARINNTEILELLIKAGADIDREVNHRNALAVAIIVDGKEARELLEANGAEVELNDGVDGPYVYFDTTSAKTVILSVDQRNRIRIDSLETMPDELFVQTPGNKSFRVPLREPAEEKESVYDNTDRIFAISDIEGNFEEFVSSLQANGVIDDGFNWTFGQDHLVLLGDFLDRGNNVTPLLWLIYKLEHEAEQAGGKVHYLLGNHELMNIWGDFRFVNSRYKILAYKSGLDMRRFYCGQSHLGAWLRTKNVVEKIGDILFVHAGISDSLIQLDLDIPMINEIARHSIDVPDTALSEAAIRILYDYGVLWYRGYIREGMDYEKAPTESVDEVLAYFDAEHIIVGHSIVGDISQDYGGKIIRIDVDHYHNPSCGILITPDAIYKAMEDGETELMLERN